MGGLNAHFVQNAMGEELEEAGMEWKEGDKTIGRGDAGRGHKEGKGWCFKTERGAGGEREMFSTIHNCTRESAKVHRFQT